MCNVKAALKVITFSIDLESKYVNKQDQDEQKCPCQIEGIKGPWVCGGMFRGRSRRREYGDEDVKREKKGNQSSCAAAQKKRKEENAEPAAKPSKRAVGQPFSKTSFVGPGDYADASKLNAIKSTSSRRTNHLIQSIATRRGLGGGE
ncbi:hypothetical protein BDR04DRAFT_1122815 [Suillus decipiens]|nr:hypothetical protein BDR04DRAFT_1122815 [Suillus decipiens]